MANKVKRTVNQQLFQKERARLLRTVRRAEKQGYIFPEDVVPKLPKRVTKKQVEKVQGYKAKDLYKNATFVYYETGEIVPAEIRKKEVRKEATIKAQQTRKEKLKSLSTVSTSNSINIPTVKEPTVKEKVPSVKAPKLDKLEAKNVETPTPKFDTVIIQQKGTQDYPTINVIDIVRERIITSIEEKIPTLERHNYRFFDLTHENTVLLRIFDRTISNYSGREDELSEYLKEKQDEIWRNFDIIENAYDSTGEFVERAYGTLATLLNIEALSSEDAEQVSELSDVMGYSEVQ